MEGVHGADPLKKIALVGFMGAGKTTIARRTGLRVADIDRVVESISKKTIVELFAEGEETFRGYEQRAIGGALLGSPDKVIDMGGGAITSPKVRELLREHATVVWLDVDVDTCWERVKGTDRPLAQDEGEFRRLYEERRALYAEVADVVARDEHDVVLAAAGVHVERGALQKLGSLVPGDGPVALVSDATVAGIHGMDAQLALGSRLAETHELPSGEEAKTLAHDRPAVAGAPARPARDDRRARRRLHHRRGRVCSGCIFARHRLGARGDEPRGAGGRRHRRQDGHRPAAGEEPRRRVPLAGNAR